MTTEYCHFQVTASSLSRLLGLFGTVSQVSEMCNIIRKSPHRALVTSEERNPGCGGFSGSVMYKREQDYLERANLTSAWAQVRENAKNCVLKEHISILTADTRKLLFGTQYFLTSVHDVGNRLKADFQNLWTVTIYPLINQICTGDELALDTLRQVKIDNQLDSLNTIIDLVDVNYRMLNYILRSARIQYGKKGESSFVEFFNASMQQDGQIKQQQKQVFAFSGLKTPKQGFTWGIEGRLDGMIDGDIIEIKHRTIGLLAKIPLYDLIQVHAYMYIMKSPKTRLVQCIRSQNGCLSDTQTVFFNEHFWSEIMQNLQRVMCFMEILVTCDIAWDSFIRCPEKKTIIERYVGPPPEISDITYGLMMCPIRPDFYRVSASPESIDIDD
jgi:hypothetical protein